LKKKFKTEALKPYKYFRMKSETSKYMIEDRVFNQPQSQPQS
jgi:hypothetical protein